MNSFRERGITHEGLKGGRFIGPEEVGNIVFFGL
jgi:hypothetical protein